MTSRGVKRKHQDDEDNDREKEKKTKTIDERVARFFGKAGDDDDDQKSGGVYEPQTQLEKESKAASRQMRHASQKNYFSVLGLQTPFSRAFCMDVFMFFTPRERLNLLMKFWRVWRDHFSKEKLPWRWVTAYAMRPFPHKDVRYPIPERMYNFMSECTDTTISDHAARLYDTVSGNMAFYFVWRCLDETCNCSILEPNWHCEQTLRLS